MAISLKKMVVLTLICGSFITSLFAGRYPAGKVTDNGIKVTFERNLNHCSKYFGNFSFMLENHNDDFLRVSSVKFDFGSSKKNDNVNLITGEKLILWLEAHSDKIYSKRAVNKALSLGVSVVSDMVSTIASDRNENVSKGARVAGEFADATYAYNVIQGDSEISGLTKALHSNLIKTPYYIAPSFKTEKSIVFHSKNNSEIGPVQEFDIVITYEKGMKDTIYCWLDLDDEKWNWDRGNYVSPEEKEQAKRAEEELRTKDRIEW